MPFLINKKVKNINMSLLWKKNEICYKIGRPKLSDMGKTEPKKLNAIDNEYLW